MSSRWGRSTDRVPTGEGRGGRQDHLVAGAEHLDVEEMEHTREAPDRPPQRGGDESHDRFPLALLVAIGEAEPYRCVAVDVGDAADGPGLSLGGVRQVDAEEWGQTLEKDGVIGPRIEAGVDEARSEWAGDLD